MNQIFRKKLNLEMSLRSLIVLALLFTVTTLTQTVKAQNQNSQPAQQKPICWLLVHKQNWTTTFSVRTQDSSIYADFIVGWGNNVDTLNRALLFRNDMIARGSCRMRKIPEGSDPKAFDHNRPLEIDRWSDRLKEMERRGET